jgi:hypothetical protein
MFCPKCASEAVPGQRFCRQCGTNLGLIVDAIEGRRAPIDFDALKEDFRQLGSSLRETFQEAHEEFKKTRHLDQKHRQRRRQKNVEAVQAVSQAAGTVAGVAANTASEAVAAVMSSPEIDKLKWNKRLKVPAPRKYSLQQAALSIFGGAAQTGVLYYLLNIAGNSGLLSSIEVILQERLDLSISGLVPLLQALWISGLVPVARGTAHLINGIFLAPKATEASVTTLNAVHLPSSSQPVSGAIFQSPSSTNELEREPVIRPFSSITEENTERLGAANVDIIKTTS